MPADDDDVPVTPIDSHEAQNIVFENLLTLLNSASALGVGPRMEDLRSPKKLARPASARAIQRGLVNQSDCTFEASEPTRLLLLHR